MMHARQIAVKTGRGGTEIRRETRLEGATLTIGRSTTNRIQLSGLGVGLHHAEFFMADGGVSIRGLEGHEIFVNGIAVIETRLATDDVIRIQQHEIRLNAPGDGLDLDFELVELERSGDALQELEKRTRVGLDRGLFTQRKLSWLLVAAILVAFAWGPLFVGTLETSWSSGPMARAHAGIATQCESCHLQGFEPVGDDACRSCHESVGEHIDPEHPHVGIDCASCHVEHNGSLGLTDLEQSFCVECHNADLSPPDLQSAEDFGVHHPLFSVELESPESRPAGRFRVEANPREAPGIRFNHVHHTVTGVVDSRTGDERILACGECHEPEPGGKGISDISFERHCQDCHSLGFDTEAGKREAIHGDPVAMRQSLREFFAWQELEKVQSARQSTNAAPSLRRGRPGANITPEQRREIAASVETLVERASHFLMRDETRGVCIGCHDVLRGEASDGGDDVAPVTIPRRWMTRSIFDHRSHRFSECTDCHPDAADESDLGSTDAGHIGLPDRANCRECHAGGHASEPFIPSNCVMCHEFHILGNTP